MAITTPYVVTPMGVSWFAGPGPRPAQQHVEARYGGQGQTEESARYGGGPRAGGITPGPGNGGAIVSGGNAAADRRLLTFHGEPVAVRAYHAVRGPPRLVQRSPRLVQQKGEETVRLPRLITMAGPPAPL